LKEAEKARIADRDAYEERERVLRLVSEASVADTANVGERTWHDELAARRAKAAPSHASARRRPSWLRQVATLGADVGALVLSGFVAAWAATALDGAPLVGRLIGAFPNSAASLWLLLGLTPVWVFVLYVFGLYRESGRSIGGAAVLETLNGLSALTAASWLVFIGLVVVMGSAAPVSALIAFWIAAVVLVPVARWVSRVTVWSRAGFAERTLIVGAGEVGHLMATKIAKHPEYRLEVVGFVDDGEPLPNGQGPEVPVLGSLSDLEEIIKREQLDRVIVAFSRARHGAFLRLVRACADHGVKVNIVPRLFEVVSSRAGVDDIEGIPLLDVGHAELSRFNMAVKRVFDLVVGGIVFVMIVPLLVVVAVLIKLDSPGPVFFRQQRMGRGGRTFDIYKFRSMRIGADSQRHELADQNEYSGPMFKMKEDPRVTRVGSALRRWSLDELPQIFNVLNGEMSLVGPRPLWVEEAKQCRGWTQKRLDITPGITGLWQVLGRNDIPFDEMVKLDYLYVTSWSLGWDIKLLMQTIPAVLDKRGAY
jgi:exopolysaccharide biosynthesis polyprenyl glycosylphosphotransferase